MPDRLIVEFEKIGATWRCSSLSLPTLEGTGMTIQSAWDSAMNNLLAKAMDDFAKQKAKR